MGQQLVLMQLILMMELMLVLMEISMSLIAEKVGLL